jgi:hypothetical protein
MGVTSAALIFVASCARQPAPASPPAGRIQQAQSKPRAAKCGERNEDAPPPDGRADAARGGEVAFLQASSSAPCGQVLSKAEEVAALMAVRKCWLDAHAPSSAGVVRLDARIEVDGSVAAADVDPFLFKDGFRGARDSEAELALEQCAERWLEAQRYPGLDSVQIDLRLNPIGR